MGPLHAQGSEPAVILFTHLLQLDQGVPQPACLARHILGCLHASPAYMQCVTILPAICQLEPAAGELLTWCPAALARPHQQGCLLAGLPGVRPAAHACLPERAARLRSCRGCLLLGLAGQRHTPPPPVPSWHAAPGLHRHCRLTRRASSKLEQQVCGDGGRLHVGADIAAPSRSRILRCSCTGSLARSSALSLRARLNARSLCSPSIFACFSCRQAGCHDVASLWQSPDVMLESQLGCTCRSC